MDSFVAARTTIRLLESLIRVAQAHARLMFRDRVEVRDAVVAITLVDSSNQNQPILRELQGVAQSTFPENPDAVFARQEQLVLRSLGLLAGADPDAAPDSPPPAPADPPPQPPPPKPQAPPRPPVASSVLRATPKPAPSPVATPAAPDVDSSVVCVDDEAPSLGPRDLAQHSPLSNDRWWRAQPGGQTSQQLSGLPLCDAPPPTAPPNPAASQRRVAFTDQPVPPPPAASAAPAVVMAAPKRPAPAPSSEHADVADGAPEAKVARHEKPSPPNGSAGGVASQATKAAPSMLDDLDALGVSEGDPFMALVANNAPQAKGKRGKFLDD